MAASAYNGLVSPDLHIKYDVNNNFEKIKRYTCHMCAQIAWLSEILLFDFFKWFFFL